MSYHDTLKAEINRALDLLAESGQQWVAQWIANSILNEHREGLAPSENDHVNFWRHCAYAEVRDQVTACINKRAGDRREEEGEQMRLFGWEHLQSYYVVMREGQEIGVPIHDLSNLELEEKARKYRAMAASCYAHADELDHFRRTRPARAA